MKLGSATKLDKRNTALSKKFDDDLTSANYDVMVIFPIYGWFGAIGNPDYGCMVYDSYIFINRNFLSHRRWKQN